MSHTYDSVMAKLGDRAELVGGVITVYENGKHTDIGRIDQTTGVFTLTAEGLLVIDGAPTPKKRGGKSTQPADDEVPPAEEGTTLE